MARDVNRNAQAVKHRFGFRGVNCGFGTWLLWFLVIDLVFIRMPLYEFHCAQCDRDSEILVRSSNWEGTKCPRCGSSRLEKKFSVFASTSGAEAAAPSCTGQPKSCGMCGTGKPHSH